MARGYLNSLSFPAGDIDTALELLQKLRAGLGQVLTSHMLTTPIMCGLRAAELPLSPSYEILRDGLARQGGRFRDTILFFLSVLDQRSPVHVELDLELQEDVVNHVVEGLEQTFLPDQTAPLIACALDAGILLSIGSGDPWLKDRISFAALTNTTDVVRRFECDNICDLATAKAVDLRLKALKNELVFENWDYITGAAGCSAQIIDWFSECRRRPGLEQVIMRSVGLARRAEYRIDGNLIKKLRVEEAITIFEVRAHFNGSNNVRLLFSRSADGRALYGFGGTKTAPDWYDHAIPQATRHIKSMLS